MERKLDRKTYTLSKPQVDWLKSEADRLGINDSEIVRRIIDTYRGAWNYRPASELNPSQTPQ